MVRASASAMGAASRSLQAAFRHRSLTRRPGAARVTPGAASSSSASDDSRQGFGDQPGCCGSRCLHRARGCRDLRASNWGPLAVAAGPKPRQPKVSENPERMRLRHGKTRRDLALRIGASVWVVVVLSTLGVTYLVRKTIQGADAKVSIFDGFDIIAYIGLAVVLAPSMVVILVSTWLDRVEEASVIGSDRLCDICSGSGQVRSPLGEPGRECVACAGTGERDYGAGHVMSLGRTQAPGEQL